MKERSKEQQPPANEPITIEGNIRVVGEEENGYLVDYFHIKTDLPYVGIDR